MQPEAHDERWEDALRTVARSVQAWRKAHPKATLTEIETAVDERLAAARAQLITTAAQASAAADLTALPAAARPRCAQCGERLQVHGHRTRYLSTLYDQPLVLRRSYARCPACGQGVFPPG